MNSDEQIKVFLIEDSDDDSYLISKYLTSDQRVPIDVQVATSLSSALERLSREQYDVILSDLGLPDSRGLDTFVKVHAAYPGVPIIILTGLDDETQAFEAVQQGAQDYLVKSLINGSSLVRVIRYAIERHKLLTRLEKSLKEIKTLQALLPICAWCKNIRDDKGYWKNVENYITEHTGTAFTHGICPACVDKLREQFPDSFTEEVPKDE